MTLNEMTIEELYHYGVSRFNEIMMIYGDDEMKSSQMRDLLLGMLISMKKLAGADDDA
ncbi:hypothetical protein UFOVP23_21 [uncultured Caudovirales phage]|uniref:Uncharacterized protein n=1 Tax=uncultured Caudovirales phage TaxID=2100421 RepID=A0A6J5T7S5_9CAUD|nr:hypothetical protein UFOVP23_21 [uncultured Caudovirales phage]